MRTFKSAIDLIIIDADSFDIETIKLFLGGMQEIKVCMLSNRDLPDLSASHSNFKQDRISYPVQFLPIGNLEEIITEFDSTVFSTGILSSNISVLQELFRSPITGILFAENSFVMWELCGKLPDFIIAEPSQLNNIINGKHRGYISEAAAVKRAYQIEHPVGVITITSKIRSVDMRYEYSLVSGGRYFKTGDQRSKTNYIGAMVLKNKNCSVYQGDFYDIFQFLLKNGIKTTFNGITRVPPKIDDKKWDRFNKIVSNLCEKFECINYSDSLEALPEIASQKTLSTAERWENAKGKFVFSQNVKGKHIVLIDDVITSGATTLSCADSIMDCDARQVTIVTILINQYSDARLNSSFVTPNCSCGGEFLLRANTRNGSFFYGCSRYPECRNSLSIDDWNSKLNN